MSSGHRHPLTLAMLASALAASPRQLERAYDEIGLTTFGAHLRAVRLRNAAELLAHQPLTVTDVARLVGYRQPSHFVNRGHARGVPRRRPPPGSVARASSASRSPPPTGDGFNIAPQRCDDQ